MIKTTRRGSALVYALLATVVCTPVLYKGLHTYLGLGDNVGRFMWGCITRPGQNGALAPCSTFVAQEMIRPLEQECIRRSEQEGTVRVLEVGAGSGILTRHVVKLLENVGINYEFDVVEIDQGYCKNLAQEFSSNEHVKIHCMSVLDWQKGEPYDIIISTVPFSIFGISDVKAIWDLYKNIIKPGGHVSYVKLTGGKLAQAMLWGEKKKQYLARQELLKELNKKYSAEHVLVKRNIPPLDIYHCRID